MTYRIVCVGLDKFKIQRQYAETHRFRTGFWYRTVRKVTLHHWADMYIRYNGYGYILNSNYDNYDLYSPEYVPKDVAKSIIDKYVQADKEIENEQKLDAEAILANPPEVYP